MLWRGSIFKDELLTAWNVESGSHTRRERGCTVPMLVMEGVTTGGHYVPLLHSRRVQVNEKDCWYNSMLLLVIF